MVVAPPRSASILKSQAASSPSPDVPVTSSVSTYARLYIIEDKRVSECALVLFARDELLADEYIVIKILSKYKDTRYDLSTIDRRQCCQLEALLRNRTFSPEV